MRAASRNRADAVAIATALTVFGYVRASEAQEAVRIEAGDHRCPDASALSQSVRNRLGRDPFVGPDAASLDVRIESGAEPASLRARILLKPGTNAAAEGRTIVSAAGDCDALIRAVALAAALALERDAPREPAPTAPSAPAPAPASAPATPAPTAVEPESASAKTPFGRERGMIAASIVGQVGLVPRPSPGVALDGRLRLSGTGWLSLRATYLPPASMPNDDFAMSLMAAAIGACVEPFAGATAVAFGCAHAHGGALLVGDARTPMSKEGGFFGAAGLSAGARFAVAGPVGLIAHVEGIVPITHPTYVTETCPRFGFEQPVVALVAGIGAAVTIP